MTYKDFTVCHLTQEQHLRTCGYWFTVQESSMAHTAFRTRAGLELWMNERGLAFDGELGNAPSWCRLKGTYHTVAHLHDADCFEGLKGYRTRTMSNGDYVDAIITPGEDGTKTVHTLNPNVKTRRTYDHAESRHYLHDDGTGTYGERDSSD